VDMNGRVVGINSAIATNTRSSAGVGFAIPMSMVSQLADKLIKDGKVNRARVGLKLKMDPVTPSLARKLGLDANTHGVVVDEVAEGSPGEKAGLKGGDVIVEFDGHAVTNVPTFRNLVSSSDAGKTYSLKFFRGGKSQVVQVSPSPESEVLFAQEREAQKAQEREAARAKELENRRSKESDALKDLKARGPVTKFDGFGLSLQQVGPETTATFGYPKDTAGLIVTGVKEGSPAAKAGLEQGDLITKVVKDKKIQAVKGVEDVAAAAEGNDDLTVFVKDVRNPENDAQVVTLSKKTTGDKDAPKDDQN